jgi:hypothetical protein
MATVTGTAQALSGLLHEASTLQVALCGYGSQIPRVQGGALFGDLDETVPINATDGTFEFTVSGNDAISPAGTYYTVTMQDGNGDTIQVNAYQFIGDNDYDLNTIDPYDPNIAPPPLPYPILSQLLIIAFSPTPNFPGDQYHTWGFRLTGDVTSSSLSGIVAGNLYTFLITQDGTGGWAFTWPTLVQGESIVDPEPGSLTVQTFIAIANGGPLYPIGPGTYYP